MDKVVLTLDSADDAGALLTRGSARIYLSARVAVPGSGPLLEKIPARAKFTGTPPTVALYPNDLLGLDDGGQPTTVYTIFYDGLPLESWSFVVRSDASLPLLLSSLAAVAAVAPAQQYLPLTSGAPAAGQVPVFTGTGYATAPGDAATGPTGPQGPAGPTGATGAQGPQGAQGTTGAAGAAGTTGAAGAKGDTGATGPAGPTGPTGATGATGATGPAGSPASNIITSVNSKTGAVVLSAADVGADAAGAASTVGAASAQRASNLSDLASAATARTNLGLGSAATHASTDFDAAGSAAAVSAATLQKQAATSLSGYTLVNGTGNIITWTAPSDGAMHRFILVGLLRVTGTETGGAISVSFTAPDGTASGPQQVSAAGQAAGLHNFSTIFNTVVQPGSTVTVSQTSALTAGAAVWWGEIWAL